MKKIILIVALLLTTINAGKIYRVPYTNKTSIDELYTMLFLKVAKVRENTIDKEYLKKLKFEIRIIKKKLKELKSEK
jgi:hypothetical protein